LISIADLFFWNDFSRITYFGWKTMGVNLNKLIQFRYVKKGKGLLRVKKNTFSELKESTKIVYLQP